MEKRSYGEEKRVTGHLNLADPIIWLAPEITRQYVANWTKRGLDAETQTDGWGGRRDWIPKFVHTTSPEYSLIPEDLTWT